MFLTLYLKQAPPPQTDDTDTGSLSKYLVKTTRHADMTAAGPTSGLDDSTFCLDDLLHGPSPADGDRLEASGFNADDVPVCCNFFIY